MTVDTKALRKPRQSVEIDVLTLKALLDELDVLRGLAAACKAAHDDEIPECAACGERVHVRTADGYDYCGACAEDCEVEPA